jgi:ribosome-binding factor A
MGKRETRRGDRSPAEASDSFEEEGDDDAQQAAGHRHARLQQILLDELGALVRDELSDPKLDGVMVTSVDERERLERAIARAAPFLRASLADSVDLKQVPALNFMWDRGADERPGAHEAAQSK